MITPRYLVQLGHWCAFTLLPVYSRKLSKCNNIRYPAGHVRIHEMLYAITNGGKNMGLAQDIYGILYIATLALTCAIYRKSRAVPNWLVLLLPLSKRLHSIYALRMFNDCWAVFFSQLAILTCQYGFSDSAWLLFRYDNLLPAQ